MKVPVVTAITAGRDRLKPQPTLPDAEYVAFLDDDQRCPGWRIARAYSGFDDPVRNAKHHKVLLHRWLPSAAYSLWIDGSVRLTFDGSLLELIETHLRDSDIAVFVHRKRNCIYDEAEACMELRKDEPGVIARQAGRYRGEGYAPKNGLAELSVILRRHTARTNHFCEVWWEEITSGSRRDQLSFDYVAWKLGVRYACFPGTLGGNGLFARDQHTDET